VKLHIELVPDLPEAEVVIKCAALTPEIQQMQTLIAGELARSRQMVFYKNNEEYYLPLSDILFFETGDETVFAHTAADVYRIRFRLYELEELLPGSFVRVSKSAILNTRHILSVDRNLSASSLVTFHQSHKQVYVSRFYYKNLKQKLIESRDLL